MKKGQARNKGFWHQISVDINHANNAHGIPTFQVQGDGIIMPIVALSDAERSNFYLTARLAFETLLNDSWVIRNDLEEAYSISKFLVSMDSLNYVQYLNLARLCVQLDYKMEAIDAYDKAIECCQEDKRCKRQRILCYDSDELIHDLKREKSKLLNEHSPT